MKKWVKRIIMFLLLITIVLLINNVICRLGYNRAEKEEKQLTKFELEDVKEAKRLKEVYGDKLFNGFSKSDIPILVYNDKYEFLINDTPLDASFMVDLERFKEWEEGLGKYAEIKMYDFAQKDSNSPKVYNYRNNRPYWKSDFKSIRDNLGLRDVEYRFYLSEMAQAMILDNLSDKWNVNIDKDGVYLEGKLREIVMKINK